MIKIIRHIWSFLFMNKSAALIMTTIISLLLVLTSCEDNTNPNPVESDYFPLTLGNYWVFNSYELYNNNRKISGTEKRDSVVVEKKLTLEGKTASLLSVYRDEQIYDSIYISKETSKVYMLFDENDIDVPNFKSQWFLIADFSKTSNTEWHLYDSILTNYSYNFEDSTINTTYHHTINGRFEYEENFPYNNVSIKSKVFQIKYDTRLYFLYKFPDNISTDEVEVNRLRQNNYHFTFAENIGLARIKYDPYVISTRTIPFTIYSKTESYKGLHSDLTGYRIIILEK